jgi:hypothetical protein
MASVYDESKYLDELSFEFPSNLAHVSLILVLILLNPLADFLLGLFKFFEGFFIFIEALENVRKFGEQ